MTKQPWGFYGRRDELARLSGVLGRGRWFFVKVSGRRRIGKTALVQQALQPAQRGRVLYIQVPDSDPAGVVCPAREPKRARATAPGSSLLPKDACGGQVTVCAGSGRG